jgi:phosphoribosyl-AMP cyclohydrolase
VAGASAEIIKRIIDGLTFDQAGLIPTIAQQFDSGEVLMLAWMNRDAISASLTEGRAVYWSRSRAALWRKGETSGQTQELKEMRWDCDADTILLLVDQTGVACHTGRRNCFFNALRDGEVQVIAEIDIAPDKLYGN